VLPIGVPKLVHRGGGDLILPTEPWLGFRRGVGGQCAGMNESMNSVWLGRCPYLFAQETCSNGQMSHRQEGLIIVAMGMRHLIWTVATGNHSGNRHITSSACATVILISNGHSGITRAYCYCALYIYSAIVFL
jgi:hypothetical protein